MTAAGDATTEGETWLVGDIGATNARFGLVSPGGKLLHWHSYAGEDYPTIDDALAQYLGERAGLPIDRKSVV